MVCSIAKNPTQALVCVHLSNWLQMIICIQISYIHAYFFFFYLSLLRYTFAYFMLTMIKLISASVTFVLQVGLLCGSCSWENSSLFKNLWEAVVRKPHRKQLKHQELDPETSEGSNEHYNRYTNFLLWSCKKSNNNRVILPVL